MQDVTLHDGTFLPKGTLVVAAKCAMHDDDNNYEHADKFDPFRFARMREVPGEALKHQFASTSPEYIPFGHGKLAWYVLKAHTALLYTDISCKPWEILRFDGIESDYGISAGEL